MLIEAVDNVSITFKSSNAFINVEKIPQRQPPSASELKIRCSNGVESGVPQIRLINLSKNIIINNQYNRWIKYRTA